MRHILFVPLFLFLLSGCTFIGIAVDSANYNQRQERANSIQDLGQEVTLQKQDGEEIQAVFQNFSYNAGLTEHADQMSERSFPQIGDKVSLILNDETSQYGTFSGLMRKDDHFELMLIPSEDTDELNSYKLENIIMINVIEDNLRIDQLEAEQITVHYDMNNTPGMVPLNELSYLNKQVVKKGHSGAVFGLILDVTTIGLFAWMAANSLTLSLGGSW